LTQLNNLKTVDYFYSALHCTARKSLKDKGFTLVARFVHWLHAGIYEAVAPLDLLNLIGERRMPKIFKALLPATAATLIMATPAQDMVVFCGSNSFNLFQGEI